MRYFTYTREDLSIDHHLSNLQHALLHPSVLYDAYTFARGALS